MNTESTIRDWSDFEEIANRAAEYWREPYSHTVFRGQSQAWGNLMPSLARRLAERSIDVSQSLTIETMIRDELLARGESTPLAQLSSSSWLAHTAILRHYGAPTRVLDWSQSPFVALYFACANDHCVDGELWHVSAHSVNEVHGQSAPISAMDSAFDPWFEELMPQKRIAFVKLGRHSRRSAAQLALFSVADDPRSDHRGLLDDASKQIVATHDAGWAVHGLHRCLVPSNLKQPFLKKLWHRNVHGASLFPDMDGLSKYANDLVTLYSFGIDETNRKMRERYR